MLVFSRTNKHCHLLLFVWCLCKYYLVPFLILFFLFSDFSQHSSTFICISLSSSHHYCTATVPIVSKSCGIALLYNKSTTGRLVHIECTWNSVPVRTSHDRLYVTKGLLNGWMWRYCPWDLLILNMLDDSWGKFWLTCITKIHTCVLMLTCLDRSLYLLFQCPQTADVYSRP